MKLSKEGFKNWVRDFKPQITTIDRYIIKKFIGTYVVALLLIIGIVIIFDLSEKVDKFVTNQAPLKLIIFQYYANFIPYFVNMFSPMFVFITVIFFTSKMAANTEIIAILAGGISFKRLMWPYFVSAAAIVAFSLILNLYVIPPCNKGRLAFEQKYVKKKYENFARNVHYQISPGNFLYLSANEYWRGEEPFVSEINAFFFATNKELTNAYEYNRVDAIITRSVTTAQYRTGVNALNMDYRTRQLEVLLFNLKAYELEDVRVRKAIRYAIDPDALSENAYYGMTSRTDTMFPSNTWMYYDASGADGEAYFTYNLERANQLLTEAGWTDSDGDGKRDMIRDGKKVNLSLRLWVYEEAENSVRVETANAIRGQLAKAGIEVRVFTLSFGLARERLQAGNFDLCMAAFQMDSVPDPGFLLYGPNTGNYGRYKSEKMNSLISDLRKCRVDIKDGPDFKELLNEIQAEFARDCPFVCLYFRGGAVLTRMVYTSVRDVREPEVLKGIEKMGLK